MRFDVVSLFPEMVLGAAAFGVTGRAIERDLVQLAVWNPRDYVYDRHKTVDDRPYGGGPGMLMKYQPLADAVAAAKIQKSTNSSKVICLTPQGRPITQSLLQTATNLEQLILIAGRYEGIDERFVTGVCDEEWSLGDFVISGGELAALVIVDGITRLLPGVLGDEASAVNDSYTDGLLDCPHYTRPEVIQGQGVPQVLLSGHHADIERWRLKQALGRTWQRRPDMLKNKVLTPEQSALLQEFKNEV
jgi:tRNA (guanine37-N1)-methyltransferase